MGTTTQAERGTMRAIASESPRSTVKVQRGGNISNSVALGQGGSKDTMVTYFLTILSCCAEENIRSQGTTTKCTKLSTLMDLLQLKKNVKKRHVAAMAAINTSAVRRERKSPRQE